MKVLIASDHAGFSYKMQILKNLSGEGYAVQDLGTNSTTPTDYPDHAQDMAEALLHTPGAKGILICGSGVGVCIASNKFKGIRAGICHDTYSAHQAVEHDDMNVLCLGEWVIGIELAYDIVHTFLKAKFSQQPRQQKRLDKIRAIENKNMKEIKYE